MKIESVQNLADKQWDILQRAIRSGLICHDIKYQGIYLMEYRIFSQRLSKN